MTALKQPSLRPNVTAFVIWFLHFMVIWAAGEIWPHQWTANALAWGVTAIALLAVGVHCVRLKAQHADGELPDWNYRFARGAIAIATAAVVFSALPSVVFLPRAESLGSGGMANAASSTGTLTARLVQRTNIAPWAGCLQVPALWCAHLLVANGKAWAGQLPENCPSPAAGSGRQCEADLS